MNGLPQPNISASTPDPVAQLMALAKSDMAHVETVIEERMGSETTLIADLANHLVDAGGKRIRPLITVSTARMLGYEGEAHIRLAAAVEFIHSATLLHDDVVDESELRRGRKSANLVWGNPHSVLVGDFLFARSFMLMVEAGSMAALKVLSQAASTIAEGEVRQLLAAGRIDTSRATYMSIISAKTAALFSAASQTPAIIADRSSEEEARLETYGRELGLAFQLVDDALDYGGLAADLGKNTGDDFRESKMTLPVALALEAANEAEHAFWRRTMGEGDQREGDLDEAIAILRRHGALDATLVEARKHAATAQAALDGFADNAWRAALSGLAEFVVERAY